MLAAGNDAGARIRPGAKVDAIDPSGRRHERGGAAARREGHRGPEHQRQRRARVGRLHVETRDRGGWRSGARPHSENSQKASDGGGSTTAAISNRTAQPRDRGIAVTPAARLASSRFVWGASSVSRASPISRSRLRGSFSRQRRTNRATAGGTCGGSACQSGSRVTIADSTSVTVSPVNGRLPVSISNNRQPNAQMSTRLFDVLSARLLGRHVGGGAQNHADSRDHGRGHGWRSCRPGRPPPHPPSLSPVRNRELSRPRRVAPSHSRVSSRDG